MAQNPLFNITLGYAKPSHPTLSAAKSRLTGVLSAGEGALAAPKPAPAAAPRAVNDEAVRTAVSPTAAPPTTVLSPAEGALGAPESAPAAATQAIGVITAQQSAITFAGAPAAVTVVWKVLGVAIPAVAASTPFAIALSLAVGMLIYWQSAAFTSKKDRIAGFLFAFVNSFAIAAATLGINTAVGR